MIRRRHLRRRSDRPATAAAGAAILLIELIAASAGIRVVVELIVEIRVARVAGLALAIARFGRLLRLVQVAAAVVGIVAARIGVRLLGAAAGSVVGVASA